MHIVQGLMYVVLFVGIRYLVNTFVGGWFCRSSLWASFSSACCFLIAIMCKHLLSSNFRVYCILPDFFLLVWMTGLQRACSRPHLVVFFRESFRK